MIRHLLLRRWIGNSISSCSAEIPSDRCRRVRFSARPNRSALEPRALKRTLQKLGIIEDFSRAIVYAIVALLAANWCAPSAQADLKSDDVDAAIAKAIKFVYSQQKP